MSPTIFLEAVIAAMQIILAKCQPQARTRESVAAMLRNPKWLQEVAVRREARQQIDDAMEKLKAAVVSTPVGDFSGTLEFEYILDQLCPNG